MYGLCHTGSAWGIPPPGSLCALLGGEDTEVAPAPALPLTSRWPSPLCGTKEVQRGQQRPLLLLGSVSLVLRGTLSLSLGASTKGRYQAGCAQQGRAVSGPGTPGPGTVGICRFVVWTLDLGGWTGRSIRGRAWMPGLWGGFLVVSSWSLSPLHLEA